MNVANVRELVELVEQLTEAQNTSRSGATYEYSTAINALLKRITVEVGKQDDEQALSLELTN